MPKSVILLHAGLPSQDAVFEPPSVATLGVNSLSPAAGP